LYQYYPNKQSLLFAVMEDHMAKVTAAMEAACEHACHKPLAEMMKEIVEAFVDAKMKRADISVALYRVAADVGGPALVKRAVVRMRKAFPAGSRAIARDSPKYPRATRPALPVIHGIRDGDSLTPKLIIPAPRHAPLANPGKL
jgi:AcrR family transcriptional regulator